MKLFIKEFEKQQIYNHLMRRTATHFNIQNSSFVKEQILNWAQKFETIVWLDSNNHTGKYTEYEGVLAVGVQNELLSSSKNAFEQLKTFQSKYKDYLFGFLGYDLKNDVEQLTSENHDQLDFPDLYFFQPQKLIFVSKGQLVFKYLLAFEDEISEDFYEIKQTKEPKVTPAQQKIEIQSRIPKKSYLQKAARFLDHIHRGDLYEANFCQEFYTEKTTIDPLLVYRNLNRISKAPFAAFLKCQNKHALCASPERYLKKIKDTLISQPIKGTAKRAASKEEDALIKQQLQNDTKEKAENIMIVDLVRNDLSRIAHKGSVQVEELCEVYSFQQVHQMISTIRSKVPPKTHPVTLLQNTYPMGSMTGAPKVAAMTLIEKEEETKRGLYSGSIGYFSPEGDFDFNVVIRSILYNRENRYTSFSVGSAITAQSIPEKEWEECLLKAKAMREVLR